MSGSLIEVTALRSNVIDERRRAQLWTFAAKLGADFQDIELLQQALTHASYTKQMNPRAANNERLEFLGDAVVETVTSAKLYRRFPRTSEGELTRMRAFLVCQDSLSEIAEKLGFGEMLIFGPSENEEVSRTRPSILEDAFEAVVGALYLDRGWATAKRFVEHHLERRFDQLRRGAELLDYKSQLQEFIQRKPGRKIKYIELSNSGPDHEKVFEFAVEIDGERMGCGEGSSKQRAEQEAAREALQKLKKARKTDERS